MRFPRLQASALLCTLITIFGTATSQAQESTRQVGEWLVGAGTIDGFGLRTSLSADGTVLAVSATEENDAAGLGYVRVYRLNQGAWVEIETISGTGTGDDFGWGLSVSGDGSRVAVGAPEVGQATGGYVRVYSIGQTQLTLLGSEIPGPGGSSIDAFGIAVALDYDGSRVVVGAPGTSGYGGTVRVYDYASVAQAWELVGQPIAENPIATLGAAVAISDAGSRIALGAPSVSGFTGRVRTYDLTGQSWVQVGQDLTGTTRFGNALDLSSDGSEMVVAGRESGVSVYRLAGQGPTWESLGLTFSGTASAAEGLSVSLSADGSQLAIGANDNGTGSVEKYVRDLSDTYVLAATPITTSESDRLGTSVSLSANGAFVAVGANRYLNSVGRAGVFEYYTPGFDFGDAPVATYGSPQHAEVAGPHLGAVVDYEPAQATPTDGTGDDVTGSDDEDIAGAAGPFPVGKQSTVDIAVSGTGYLTVWIDYNQTGGFEASEKLVTSAQVTNTTYQMAFTPSAAHGDYYARYRVCSVLTECDDPAESATDGEVEDHLISIVNADFGDAPSSFGSPKHGASTAIRLGTLIDFEGVPGLPADGTGDDVTGTADEDGVTPQATFRARETTLVDVVVGTADPQQVAYLSAWFDFDSSGTFDVATETVVQSRQVGAGTEVVSVDVPITSDGAIYARYRVCSVVTECDDPTEEAQDGEVEDYQVSVLGASNVTMDSPVGEIRLENGNLIIESGSGSNLLDKPIGDVGLIVIQGTDAAETLGINWDVLDALITVGATLVVDLGEGFDALEIDDGAQVEDIEHVFETEHSGSIFRGGVQIVEYDGLDPIIDNGDAANRVFTFTGGAETVILSADGDGTAGNGFSFIDSGLAESVAFKNPTESLTVNLGDGDDTVNLGELDLPLAASFTGVTVFGENGGAIEAPDDPDVFVVTPSSNYPIAVFGEDPTAGTCPGDALRFDLAGGAVIASDDGSTVTFSSTHAPVTYDGVEVTGDADLAISVNYEELYATQNLSASSGNELVVTLSNKGPSDAKCITVAVEAALSSWISGAGSPSAGSSFTDPTWTIDSLPAGDDVTLTITGIVIPETAQTVTFTATAIQDSQTEDNVASVYLSHGFRMPAKAHVSSALYYDKPTPGGSYEALIVGLFQGAPGFSSVVWCKVPDAVPGVGVWPPGGAPVGDFFRPCADGLPYPLHVTDFVMDSNDVLWITTWGNEGLYRSEDGGETWGEAPPLGAGNNIVYTLVEDAGGGILYASMNNGLVQRSFDGGASWQEVASLPAVSAHTPWSMAAHPTEAGVIYAGTPGAGVFVSTDFGFSWAELDDPGTPANENEALLDLDGSGDDFAGHIFDLEFSTDADFLFVGTGKGVWRADLTLGQTAFTGSWTPIGPWLTLGGAGVVSPEIRTLAFAEDGADDDLVAGSWGFGAFAWDVPNTSSVVSEIALKEDHVTFLAPSTGGDVFVGTNLGSPEVVSLSGTTSTAAEAEEAALPTGYALGQNYPNPFNPTSTIGFALPASGQVRLSVYDALGREVAVLVDARMEAGVHEVQFEAGDLPSGTYLYRLQTVDGAIARTLILMK